MNWEMPMAACSTSMQFNTCHPHPSPSRKDIQTHAHTGSLWCVCVAVCEHLFRIRHLASFGRADFTNEAPWTVICLDADQQPSRRTDQKQSKVETFNLTAQYAFLLLIIFPHKPWDPQHATIWISDCWSNIPESNFFSCFQLEMKFTAG